MRRVRGRAIAEGAARRGWIGNGVGLGLAAGACVGITLHAPGAFPIVLAGALLLLAGRACWVYRLPPFRPARPGGRLDLLRWRARRALRPLAVTTVVLGLAAGGLMLIPAVNDAVLGDRPRDLLDFARMCEDGGHGDPFPRAAAYEPAQGDGPPPWVVIEDDWDAWASTGGSNPDLEDEPAPDEVQLVACSEVVGSVPDTRISCGYTEGPLGLGPATETVEFSQGRYRVTVIEARTGAVVGDGSLDGDEDVECAEAVWGENPGPEYTVPDGEQYADLLAEVAVSASR
ncbi:hypothetical protein [Streptomyces sp. 8K308]|uniref:hypothetical protein n=1 Tax=Streptomyces sp. 8K308 TaxID=2530388 RepID=UPI001404DF8E|nr:hypothetical protein [Streptomyces sp. 8K308]